MRHSSFGILCGIRHSMRHSAFYASFYASFGSLASFYASFGIRHSMRHSAFYASFGSLCVILCVIRHSASYASFVIRHIARPVWVGGSFLKPEARSLFNQALSMMVMAGDGGARPAFIQVRKGTIHAAFHLARFDMHDLTTDPCMCSDSVHVT